MKNFGIKIRFDLKTIALGILWESEDYENERGHVFLRRHVVYFLAPFCNMGIQLDTTQPPEKICSDCNGTGSSLEIVENGYALSPCKNCNN